MFDGYLAARMILGFISVSTMQMHCYRLTFNAENLTIFFSASLISDSWYFYSHNDDDYKEDYID